MHNYSIVASTETEKYRLMSIIRAAGAVLTGVSGYGTGYYIQIAATAEQAEKINNMIDTGRHMQAIDRIYENINKGYLYGHFVHNVKYPYFQTCLSVSENGEFIRWTHYGSSANKNTKAALQWIIETIFKTTPGEFEKKYLMEYRGA